MTTLSFLFISNYTFVFTGDLSNSSVSKISDQEVVMNPREEPKTSV